MRDIYNIFRNSKGISIDTRCIKEGMFFFALKGENYDANLFIDDALEKNAIAVVTSNKDYKKNSRCIIVDDTLKALQKLAVFHRNQLKCIVLGITGTNGKTTTKEFIREALSTIGATQATEGNLNNHIGVPLSILSLRDDTKFAIIEMGANHVGEISFLCNIAQPDYGIITNIGFAHLEGFGSIDGVIMAKSELYKYIAAHGKRVFVNENDERLVNISNNQRRILYGVNSLGAKVVDNDSATLNCVWTSNDVVFKINTNLIGQYNLPNVLAAIKIANYFGGNAHEITKKISDYQPKNMRSQLIKTERNNKLILDAYNANPSSMKAAIDNFILLNGENKIVVLGSMLELGKYCKDEHFKILNQLNDSILENVLLIGDGFYDLKEKFPQYNFFHNTQEAKKYISKLNFINHFVLIKGSRGIGVEDVKTVF